jgi:hypothetical protein
VVVAECLPGSWLVHPADFIRARASRGMLLSIRGSQTHGRSPPRAAVQRSEVTSLCSCCSLAAFSRLMTCFKETKADLTRSPPPPTVSLHSYIHNSNRHHSNLPVGSTSPPNLPQRWSTKTRDAQRMRSGPCTPSSRRSAGRSLTRISSS